MCVLISHISIIALTPQQKFFLEKRLITQTREYVLAFCHIAQTYDTKTYDLKPKQGSCIMLHVSIISEML